MMEVKKIITEQDLITWLHLKNKRQVRSLRDRGMPHMKLNGHEIRYDPDLVEEWMTKNAQR
jgi:hypothetical protein